MAYIRRKQKKRRKAKRKRLSSLPLRTFIDQRPEVINQRLRYGDLEGDFIVSGRNGKGALLVLHERKARYVMMEQVMKRSPHVTNERIEQRTNELRSVHSLTLDNDISFAKHEELKENIHAPVYFCRPYHSWEKGGVENTNKLIREYIPKRSDISMYDQTYIKAIERKLNTRPRKCLGFKTPLEVMQENNQFKSNDNYAIINPIKKHPSVRFGG